VLRIGAFGSYARGDWGVGSDLDLVVIVSRSERPFIERGSQFDAASLPVPADVLVYTQTEWDRLQETSPRFHRTVTREAEWLYRREA
jgi:predicted nucleotidyltransferase